MLLWRHETDDVISFGQIQHNSVIWGSNACILVLIRNMLQLIVLYNVVFS